MEISSVGFFFVQAKICLYGSEALQMQIFMQSQYRVNISRQTVSLFILNSIYFISYVIESLAEFVCFACYKKKGNKI